jgi:hypothetical protein
MPLRFSITARKWSTLEDAQLQTSSRTHSGIMYSTYQCVRRVEDSQLQTSSSNSHWYHCEFDIPMCKQSSISERAFFLVVCSSTGKPCQSIAPSKGLLLRLIHQVDCGICVYRETHSLANIIGFIPEPCLVGSR